MFLYATGEHLVTIRSDQHTVEVMAEFQIQTPGGVHLAGQLTRPVDTHDAVVIFVHGFLSDRHGDGWFDALGRVFRRNGYATCAFDMSGSGLSETCPITVADQQLDLRAISGWLMEQGLTRQVIYAQGFGAKVALSARPRHVQAMVCTLPLVASQSFDWSDIFSDEQLEQLDKAGQCLIEDDLNPLRTSQIVSRQSLNDISQSDASELLDSQRCPVLILAGDGPEHADVLEACSNNFHLLPDGSKVVTIPSDYAAFGNTFSMSEAADAVTTGNVDPRKRATEHVGGIVTQWLQPRVPPQS